jgi:hypothetical protein
LVRGSARRLIHPDGSRDAVIAGNRGIIERSTSSRRAGGCFPGYFPSLFIFQVFLFSKSFGEFDEDAPVGRILDFPEGNDEPQPLDNVQIDLIILKQLQQFVAGMIGINAHRKSSINE